MKQGLIDLVVVLDRSNTFRIFQEAIIKGYNGLLAEQLEVEEGGTVDVTLFLFDNTIDEMYSGTPIAEVPTLSTKTYAPRNQTALLDAIGQAMRRTGERLNATAEEDRPERVVLLIVSDGKDTASGRFTRDFVGKMVDHQTNAYKWEIIFASSSPIAVDQADVINISEERAIGFTPNEPGILLVFKSISDSLKAFRQGKVPTFAFTEADRERQDALRPSTTK